MLKVDRPDRLNYFNYKDDSGKHACCRTATGCKLLTLPGVAHIYTFLMNTWITVPQSYQQRVYKNTLANLKCQIQQAENPMPADVISLNAASVDNVIVLDHLISEVALEEPEIRTRDENIPIANNWMDDELHFGMPGCIEEYEDDGDDINKGDAIPTASQWWCAATEFVRFDLRNSYVAWYEGNDGDDADVDEEEDVSQADDGSRQNLEDWGHSTRDRGHGTRECDDWTAYSSLVKYDNGKANAMASDVSEAKTVL